MKTVKEIQAEVKREESVLNQLEKRGALLLSKHRKKQLKPQKRNLRQP